MSKNEKIQMLLKRKRKIENPAPSTSEPQIKEEKLEIDEKQAEKIEKAKKALLFEAKRGKERADSIGPQGWIRPPSLATNKRFLARTIQATLPRKHNKKKEDEAGKI